MPYWERLYYASPVWLQSLAVSALGFSIYRQRYGRESRALFEQLRESEHWSADRLNQFTDAEVRRVVAHAFTHVPYYRNLAKETGVAAADIQSSTDLHKLPVLEKSEIRGQPEAFVSDKQGLRGRLFELNTSGTSGTPLTIFCDRASRRRHYAFWA